jgi:hypothetical protein
LQDEIIFSQYLFLNAGLVLPNSSNIINSFQESVVGIEISLGWMAEKWWSIPNRGKKFLTLFKHPDMFCYSPIFLFCGYQESFSIGMK